MQRFLCGVAVLCSNFQCGAAQFSFRASGAYLSPSGLVVILSGRVLECAVLRCVVRYSTALQHQR